MPTPDARFKKTPFRTRTGICLGFCLVQLGTAQLAAAPQETEPKPAPVVVESLVEAEVADSVAFVGIAEPSRRSVVGSPMAGRVVEWSVDAGQTVREGEILAKLRTRALELQLAGAEAELASRRAALSELVAGALPAEIAAAQANERAAKAASEFAETNFQRTEELMQKSGASKLEYDQARRQRDESRERFINAQNTTQLLVDGPRRERIAVAEAAVELQLQSVAEIKDRLERSQIRSPFDGVVVTEFIEAGNWLSVGDPVAEIISLSPIEIRVFVPEKYINRVRVGDLCEVTVRATRAKRFLGRVRHIVPQAEQTARTFPVIVEVDNPGLSDPASQLEDSIDTAATRDLRYAVSVGMLANVVLPIGEPVKKLVVHKDALRLGGGTPAIMVVDSVSSDSIGKARRVPVQVVGTTGNRVAIASVSEAPGSAGDATAAFPKAGARVVGRGTESLTDGQAVRIDRSIQAETDSQASAREPSTAKAR